MNLFSNSKILVIILKVMTPLGNTYQDYLSVVVSQSVVPDALPPHGLQIATIPCPSPSPGVCSHSCLLSQ